MKHNVKEVRVLKHKNTVSLFDKKRERKKNFNPVISEDNKKKVLDISI